MNRILQSAVPAALSVLVGCASNPPLPPLAQQADVLLILVGGNSEAGQEKKGMKKLYFGYERADDSPIVKSLGKSDGEQRRTIAVRYFSWTGDNEFHPGLLPGHWNWIFGGSDYIRDAVPELAEVPRRYKRVVVAGWSNGGATAYELACSLTASQPDAVSLLITLDPVAWTTRTCKDMAGTFRRPASAWINVYTASGPGNRLRTSNIIAFVGRAWDDHFPSGVDFRATNPVQLLPNSDHGDTDRMWTDVVEHSTVFTAWRASRP